MFVAPSWNVDTRPLGTECLTGNEYLRFTPNGVSTKSKIKNRQSKIISTRPYGTPYPHPHRFYKHGVPTGRRSYDQVVDTNRQRIPSIPILTHREDLAVVPPFHPTVLAPNRKSKIDNR